MNEQYENFDAARSTLTRGVNLVEASAGTGKTYSITMLVLRAIVELDIPIDKILIVTFTKAATEELKDRIRKRLVEVKNRLDPQWTGLDQPEDATVSAWLATVTDKTAALRKIELGLYDIDRAGIFTIHGFCQRMLTEQALESGQLFDVELQGNVDTIRNQVAEDFWRNKIYSLAPLPCAIVTSKFPTPESLTHTISQTFGGSAKVEPEPDDIDQLVQTLSQLVEDVSSWWKTNRVDLSQLLSAGMDEGFLKTGFVKNYPLWLQNTERFFNGDYGYYSENTLFFSSTFLMEWLNGTKLRGEKKKQEFLATLPLADEQIEEFTSTAKKLVLSIRLLLADEISTEVHNRLELQSTMGFDDLIKRLEDSLQGENESLLKREIGGRFTVALIDEFQDTDMDQYFIFSSLFATKTHYLYLIGDPKQAIYKFRGADIHSYFQARNGARRSFTLNNNYRSHPYCIDEINRLFTAKDRPFWFPENVLSYKEVLPGKKIDDIDLSQGGQSLAGIKYCQLPINTAKKTGRWTSGQAGLYFINYIVSEIIKLLDQNSPAILVEDEKEEELNPKDIAILVRSNRQAEQYKEALVNVGIPAVVTSKQSVYSTPECQELYLLMLAIDSAGEMSKLKTAMTIPWFGYNGDQLYKIWQDEEIVSSWHQRFLQYNLYWQDKGFLPMMMRLLVDEEVFPNLATRSLAERSIANISQLLELVQEKESSENLGRGQLLQWLQKMIQGGKEGEESELLLESDEDAVQLVTMHGAKGLEYPVVFCPYLWYRSNRLMHEQNQVKCFTEDSGLVVDLNSEHFEERRQLAVEEEIAEDLRLLYVAMTRAKTCCYVMWGEIQASGWISDSFKSALGYLLFSEQQCSHADQEEILRQLAQEQAVRYELISLDQNSTHYLREKTDYSLAALEPSPRSLHTDWQMSSFSGLATLSEYDLEKHYFARKDKTDEVDMLPKLPAGPGFGNVIHDLLEQNSFESLAHQEDSQKLLTMIEEKCSRYGIAGDPQTIRELLYKTVTTPLNGRSMGDGRFSLAGVGDTNCLKEIGFYFRLSELVTRDINNILKNEQTCVPLHQKVMQGYLTGFIDLVCQFENKYYIVDYKTNYLGDRVDDYSPDKLVDAMQSHNYGLQYWIYSLVLDRHLSNLLPNYHYTSDFGGVLYLFVRGMAPQSPDHGIFKTLPDYDLLAALDKALGGGYE